MDQVNERNILPTLHLTDYQKELLSRVALAPGDTVADEQVTLNDNLVGARKVLEKLGLIVVQDGMVGITQDGFEIMQDENLIDDNLQLTNQGKSYIKDFNQQTESFSLIQTIHNQSKLFKKD